MEEKEIIQKLSEMHYDSSTDPETLYNATFRDFDIDHQDYVLHRDLQYRLFLICRQRGDKWAFRR